MHLSAAVLGSAAIKTLTARSTDAVLIVGSDRFTRKDLARVGCYNYTAAYTLTAVLAEIEVRDLRDLYTRIAPRALALPRLGAIALAVLGAAFEVKRLGDLDAWVAAHRPEGTRITTFLTLKHHAAAPVHPRRPRSRHARHLRQVS